MSRDHAIARAAEKLAEAAVRWWGEHQYDTWSDTDGDEHNLYDQPPEFVRLAQELAALPEPAWTRTAPSEPGVYWCREAPELAPYAVNIGELGIPFEGTPTPGMPVEWLPVSIAPPESPR